MADSDLKEQTQKYYEVGIKDILTLPVLNETYVSLSLFKFESEDEIYYNPIGGPSGFGQNENLEGQAEKYGVELFLEHYINSKLTIRETFSYLDTEMKDGIYKGKEVPGVSKYMASFGVDYNLTSSIIWHNNFNYYGRSYAYSDYDNSLDKVDDYHTFDTKLSYKINSKLDIYIGVDNLFNKKYYDYVTDYGSEKAYYPASERTYYTGFKYGF